jgi:hypothetical protein
MGVFLSIPPTFSWSTQAEQERQAAVIRAEGEAEAAFTISKALDKAGEAFVTFRRIEASKDIGECLAILPVIAEQKKVLMSSCAWTTHSHFVVWQQERDLLAGYQLRAVDAGTHVG